jgi:SAM-dependent methyltransferase
MQYDPVKSIIGTIVRRLPSSRVLFYRLLGALFLREWHVKRELRRQLSGRTTPADVYDAGCGFGQYSYYLATQFPSVRLHAIDVKEEQIDDCRRFFRSRGLGQCSFAVEDLTSINYENRFDLILSVDVMEHIPDDIGVFRNFFRALRPGGTLIVNTPSNLGGSDAHSDEDESFIEEHARNGYGVDEIRSKLAGAGFTVETVRFTYGPWGARYWRIALKVPMLLLGISKAFLLLLPFYYIVAFPVVLPMMWLDYRGENKTGTGLTAVARKS